MKHRAAHARPSRWGSWLDRVLDWGERTPLHRIVVFGLPFGVVGMVLLGGLGIWDWGHVHGRPVEYARVVASKELGETERCGKHHYEELRELTWISEDPPPGMPARFLQREACDVYDVGDSAEIVRVINADGSIHVWVDPIRTAGEAAAAVVVGFVGGWLLGSLLVAGLMFWELVSNRSRTVRKPDALGWSPDVDPAAAIVAVVEQLDDHLPRRDQADLASLVASESASPSDVLERLIGALIEHDVRLDEAEARLLGSVTGRVRLSKRADRDAEFLMRRL